MNSCFKDITYGTCIAQACDTSTGKYRKSDGQCGTCPKCEKPDPATGYTSCSKDSAYNTCMNTACPVTQLKKTDGSCAPCPACETLNSAKNQCI